MELGTMRSQEKHIGEGVASVGVEASKLKGSWREAEP